MVYRKGTLVYSKSSFSINKKYRYYIILTTNGQEYTYHDGWEGFLSMTETKNVFELRTTLLTNIFEVD